MICNPVSLPDGLLPPTEDKIAAVMVDCDEMEAADLHDGDMAIVDFDRFPRPGDACLCRCPYVDGGATSIKKYEKGTAPGFYLVSTAHTFAGPDGWMQMGMACNKIHGVIIACLAPDMTLRWQLDPQQLPMKEKVPA